MPALPSSQEPVTAAVWDEVRRKFASSQLLDTPLNSLAADLDSPPWPVESSEETPAGYIYLTYEQAIAACAARGMPPSQIATLVHILRETLAFDTPFEEMMPATRSPFVEADNPLLRALPKLGLAEDYPLTLTALTTGTLELCKLEGVDSLGGFVRFAAGLSQNIVVGGDFRELLNALAHTDENTLARLLPFRRGAKGLHLREGLQLVVRDRPGPELTRLAQQPGSASADLQQRIDGLLRYFKEETVAMRAALTAGSPLAVQLTEIEPPAQRAALVALLKSRILPTSGPTSTAAATSVRPAIAPEVAPVKRSWWNRLFSR
jgi:hypothetical protein